MHSAFLQIEDGSWSVTSSPDAVLNHDGDLLVNENEDERAAHLELLGLREGKEACIWGSAVVLTETRLWHSDSDALAELEATGEALVRHVSNFVSVTLPRKLGSVSILSPPSFWNEESLAKAKEKFDGVVAVKEGDFYRLRKDEPLWAVAEEARLRVARKVARDEEKRTPNKWAFESLADDCARSLGCRPTKSFRIEQLWTWLAAHDAAHGRRATNKLALKCAKRWCSDREKSKRWLGRWANPETVKRTDERLAAVCRLGKKNKRKEA